MKPDAIVYTSNTGHTRQYAVLLGDAVNLPVYSMEEAARELTDGTPIIYMGWLMASHVKDFDKADKKYRVLAVCAVGLCDTGSLLNETRQATKIPEGIPLFTLQGGINHSRLKGMNKLAISMLTKMLGSKKNRSAEEDRMFELLSKDGNYVSPENLAEVIDYYNKEVIS
ncbi:MAG: hypothetical protein Q4C42_06570 [Clostridia bacterium]|nr:hypothetical protein [Clostridia bacterium]